MLFDASKPGPSRAQCNHLTTFYPALGPAPDQPPFTFQSSVPQDKGPLTCIPLQQTGVLPAAPSCSANAAL